MRSVSLALKDRHLGHNASSRKGLTIQLGSSTDQKNGVALIDKPAYHRILHRTGQECKRFTKLESRRRGFHVLFRWWIDTELTGNN